jgi:hypothetical protein
MTCNTYFPDGDDKPMFICGKKLDKQIYCSSNKCKKSAEYLCDYPRCNVPLCFKHAKLIGDQLSIFDISNKDTQIHYCPSHLISSQEKIIKLSSKIKKLT